MTVRQLMFSLKLLFATLSLLSRYLLCRERILITKSFVALILLLLPLLLLLLLFLLYYCCCYYYYYYYYFTGPRHTCFAVPGSEKVGSAELRKCEHELLLLRLRSLSESLEQAMQQMM